MHLIVRGFAVVLFGTLAALAPPRDEPSLVRRALAIPGSRWRSEHSPHLHLHILRGGAAERRASTYVQAAERARSDGLRFLGAREYAPTLELAFVDTREQMRAIAGSPVGGWGEVKENAAAFVSSDSALPPLRHELAHVLSWQLWGTPGSMWLSEGVATAAAGLCRGHDLHALAAAIAREPDWVPVDGLRRHFDVRGDVGTGYYVEAGSLVRYIRERFGVRGLRAVWRSGLAGVDASLGISAAELERGWRARLASAAPAGPWPALRADIRAHGCE